MKKIDLLYFLDDFSDDEEILIWAQKPREITEIKESPERNCVLLIPESL